MSKDRNLGLLQAVREAWDAFEIAYDEVLAALGQDWLLLAKLRAPRMYNRSADWRPNPNDLEESLGDAQEALRNLWEARARLIAAQAAYNSRTIEDD
jgi:hypothetical protein